MAIAEVASKRVSGGSNSSVSSFTAVAFPGGGVTNGDFLVVLGAAHGATAAPTSIAVTDTLTTSYTVILGTVLGTWRTFIAFGFAPSTGANSVTVNPAGADGTHSGSFSIDAFTGVHATPTDVDGGTSQGNVLNSTPFTATDDLTTLTANALIVGAMAHDVSTRTLTATTNYTTIGENEANSANQCHHAVFRLATTATAYTVGVDAPDVLSGTASPGWSIQTYAFKESSTGSTISPGVGSLAMAGLLLTVNTPLPSTAAMIVIRKA